MAKAVKQESTRAPRRLRRPHTFTVMLNAEERKELEMLAKREGIGAGAWVRLMVRRMAREVRAA